MKDHRAIECGEVREGELGLGLVFLPQCYSVTGPAGNVGMGYKAGKRGAVSWEPLAPPSFRAGPLDNF